MLYSTAVVAELREKNNICNTAVVAELREKKNICNTAVVAEWGNSVNGFQG